MPQPKRILISGYYGLRNTGDEAVLSAIIKGLRARSEDIEITVLSQSPEETASIHHVKALPRMSLSTVVSAVKDCDLFISGGGSLLQDATSFKSLAYYLLVIREAKRQRRKVMVLGQGIGPLRRGISRRLTARTLSGLDLITVRDDQSAELLRDIGIKGRIEVTADPTFILTPCPEDESERLLNETGLRPDDDVVAVSLRRLRFLQRGPDPVEADAVKALCMLAKELPAKLLLVGMQSPDDLEMASEIGRKIGVPYQKEPWTAEQLLGVISRCRLVVGMRLHSLIFAAAAGVPSFGIAYDPKVESFMSAIGQSYMTLEDVLRGFMPERVKNAWNTRDELARTLEQRVPAMKRAAERNFALAGEVLGLTE